MEFSELGLSEAVLKAIEDAGHKNPTPIQEQAIPAVQMCRDMLGSTRHDHTSARPAEGSAP